MGKYVTFKPGVYEHILIAEKALGKKLPKEARVHHIDGNGKNNSNTNLVICPNESYHKLLHIRQTALDACGNASWRKCTHCQQHDKVTNLKKLPSLSESYYHRACDSARRTQYNIDRKLFKKYQ